MIKMIKNITILLIFFIWIFIFSNSYWLKNTSWLEDNIFQEAINKNFKPIDKRAETFLINLNKNKNFCFWPEKQMNFIECVNYIEKIFSIYSYEFVLWENGYAKACENSLLEVIKKQKNNAISAISSKTILDKSSESNSCSALYKFKLQIYKSVAFDILKKNKYTILRDQHKKYIQENRTRYSKLLNLIRINIWYIEKIWKAWPSKTKN